MQDLGVLLALPSGQWCKGMAGAFQCGGFALGGGLARTASDPITPRSHSRLLSFCRLTSQQRRSRPVVGPPQPALAGTKGILRAKRSIVGRKSRPRHRP